MANFTVKPEPMSACQLCRTSFYRTEAHEHMLSLKHHLELEAVTSRYYAHKCQACETSHVGFNCYASHLSTPQHNRKMKKFKTKRPLFVESTLDNETLARIRMRDKEQRKGRKKRKKKTKKKTKTPATAGRQKTMMGPGQSENKVKTQPPCWRNQPRPAASHPQPKNPNKENRLAGRLGWQLPGYPNTPQPHGGGKADTLERQNYNKKTQASQLTSSQPKCRIKSIVSGSCNIKHQDRLTRDDHKRLLLAGRLENGGKKPKRAKPLNHTSNKLTTSISIDLCTYRSFDSGTNQDYISDDLPECGSIKFDTRPVSNIPERSRDSRQSGFNSPVSVCSSHEPNPGPSQDKDTGPIQSKDVTDIISQIRRALGDPCSEAQTHREQKTDMSKAAVDTMPDPKRHVSRAGAGHDRVARFSTRALPPSLSRHISEAMPQPSLNTASRIQNVRESRQGQAEDGEETGLKSSMQRLPSSSSSQRKIRKEMYQEATKRSQEEVRVTSSFENVLVHQLSNPEDWTVEEGLPLPAAPAQVAPDGEEASGAQRVEQPRTSSGFPVSLKVESSWCHGNDGVGVSRAEKRKKKRRNTQNSDIPGVAADHSVKRQRGKSKKADSGQVDQLLAVSLKEDELSCSLLAVDASLLQARSALEAAYSEVQRLLVVKQQVMAEVSVLRARRIEILQGMQVGCSVVPRNENITAILGTQYSPPPAPVTTPNVFSSTLPALAFSPPHSLPTLSLHTPGPLHPSLPPTVTPEPAHLPQYSVPSHILKQECVYPPSQETVAVSPNLQRVSESPSAPLTTLVPASVAQQTPLTTPSTPASPLVLPPALSPSNNQRGVDVTAAPTLSKSVGVQSDKVKLEINKDLKELSSSASDSEEELEGPIKASVAPESLEDSDCSIQMVETTAAPCREEVVSIEDSDSEDDTGSPAPPQPSSAPPQASSAPPQASSAPPQASSAPPQASSAPPQASSAPPQPSSAPPQPSSAPPQASSAPTQPSSTSSGPLTVDVASSSPQTTAPTALLKNIKQDLHQREPSDEEPALGAFEGHTGPVHGLQIHAGLLYTCSADNTARAFNLLSRQCQAVFEGHTNKINCLLVSSLPGLPSRLYTGSSDNTVRCYSIKSTKCLKQISLPDRVLCLHTAWNILYVGLASGSVVSFDLKTQRQLDVFECHGPRGISCLGTAQEGSRRLLLVGSYDSSISVRDARSGLMLRSLQGHTKTVLCMKVVNDLVFSGSSDTSVHAHNIHNGELLRIYKGHGHAVTALAILGKIMVTASLDKLVRVYEIQSHDRLQVYGGHADMVLCMAVHKSVIYTGCYDGTVQAVRFNLMENYRCWWHGCSLIFAMPDHLVQHLLCDHSNAQLQNIKCRWKSCDAFFSAKQSSLKEMPGHMQKHVKQDSRLES